MREALGFRLSGHPEAVPILDWEELICVASEERILPGLRGQLGAIPSEIGEFLESVEDLNRERNELLLDQACEIAGALNSIGIEPVFLKGLAFLVEGVYPRLGCRYLYDLDLLVPAAQINAAAKALELNGYRPDAQDEMAQFRHHISPLCRPAEDGIGSAPVELHHSVGLGATCRVLGADDMLRNSKTMEWRGVRVRVPSPEQLVTHLIVHSQIHHTYSERIWPPLRAMYDLIMLDRHFGTRVNWAAVRERFRTAGQEASLLLHLLQAEKTVAMPAPFAIELGWTERLRWAHRQALNRWPQLRFADPAYLILSTCSRRARLLRSVFQTRQGWKRAAGMFLRLGFYRRLMADISLR